MLLACNMNDVSYLFDKQLPCLSVSPPHILHITPLHLKHSVQFSSVVQLCPTLCNPMDSLPCPSPTPGVCSNSCPLSQRCHPAISSSVIPFSSCLQSFPASGSFPLSQLLSGGQSIGVSASTSDLPVNTQDWSPLAWTGWISLQSKGLSRSLFQHHSSLNTG